MKFTCNISSYEVPVYMKYQFIWNANLHESLHEIPVYT